jgi:phospholipid/cholesterol/gamma-HCH transport system substrate-binding protein
MSIRGSRIHPLLAGVIAGIVMIAIVLLMASININFAAPWQSTHTLTVETTDADGIGVSSDVRINGRLVGQVTGVLAKAQVAEVTIHVDNSEWPLPATTTASVRLATLLGQKYIQLEPPPQVAGGQNLADGATIKGGKAVVDFDQILNTFDKSTRDSLTHILATGGRAVANQEGTIQQLLPDFGNLNLHSQTPTGELATRDQSLNNILINLATTADQLSRSRDDLAGVIDNMNRLTGALAQNTDSLRSFIYQGDQITITTDAVLGNGYAAKFAADLPKVNTAVHDLNTTLAQLYPLSLSFKQYALGSAVSLIYEIGDATSQSDRDGYWLRQNLQSLDLSNFGIGLPTGASTGPPTPAPPAAAGPPSLLPPVVPPLPPVCVLGVCVGGPTSAPPAGSPPAPTCTGIVIGGVCIGHTASDGSTAAPTATLSSDGTAGSQASNGVPYYVTATFAVWGGA